MQLRTASRSILGLLAMLSCSAVQALSFRAYLSVDGSDGNPCSVQLPCRLLPAALNAIVDGGEVWILDSANYNTGPVTIGKSASILAVPGAVGSVVALGGPALSITAAGLTVSLRNLVIVPFPGALSADGVNMTGASTLTIENSLIANLNNGSGVTVTGAGKLKISNTIIRNNAGFAVYLLDGVAAEISGTQMLANGNGGVITYSDTSTATTASVSDSVISGGQGGVHAITAIAGAVARVFVTRCTIEGTGTALGSTTAGVGSAVVAVSYSMITNNTTAWLQSGTGSVIRTLGNNHITDNLNSPTGALTATALQ